MKRYESYKDSGVEWIGEIPSHWMLGKLYQYSTLLSGSTPSRGVPEYWEGGTIKWMSSGEVNKRIIREVEGRITVRGHQESNTPLLPIGTVMIGLNGQGRTKGTVGLLEVETTCNQSLCGVILKQGVLPKYCFYYLDSQYYNLRGMVGEGQREGLSVSFLSSYPLILSPLPEQEQIVSFLDEKTSKIDDLIKKKEQKIELLKEYRTSLINRVITKGLNPDVHMKDSGVEWIGEIPSHWITSNVRYELDFHDNKRIPLSSEEREGRQGEYRYYGSTGVIDYVDDYLFDGEYILIGEDGSNLRLRNYPLSSVVDGKFWVNNHSHILKTKSGVNKYYSHLLEMTDFTTFITGSTQPKLTMDNLKEVALVSPPLPEQEQIVSYLEGKTGEIDSTIDSEKKKIDLLKEYRQSLISSVITGKIKVVD